MIHNGNFLLITKKYGATQKIHIQIRRDSFIFCCDQWVFEATVLNLLTSGSLYRHWRCSKPFSHLHTYIIMPSEPKTGDAKYKGQHNSGHIVE